MDKLTLFQSKFSDVNKMQFKHIKKNLDRLTESEREHANKYMALYEDYFKTFGWDSDDIIKSYNNTVKMLIKEKFYFTKYGKYRLDSLDQAIKQVYSDDQLMKDYMIWIVYTNLFIDNHLKVYHFFKNMISKQSGEKYLEVGTGHGLYFNEAMISGNFTHYHGVDLSETSVKISKYITSKHEHESDYEIDYMDVFDLDESNKYDFISSGEVLEHVEDPKAFLEKFHRLLTPEGRCYISTATNSPAPDHIYLFKNSQDVIDIIEKCGFEVEEVYEVAAEDIPKDKWDDSTELNVCFVLRKV